MVAFAILASLLAGASLVLGTPLAPQLGNCDVSKATPFLPSGQTNITVPSGQTPSKITVGVGVQNYTCTSSGTYTNVGAVANLFDISCLLGSSQFEIISGVAYDIWNASSTLTVEAVEELLSPFFPIYAQHYFITSPSGSGVSPVFDARATSHKGDPNAFILASRTGDLAAPTGKQDIDWLELANVSGSLAKTVLRLDTKLGQPPSSCSPGSAPISVKYTALYWFYN